MPDFRARFLRLVDGLDEASVQTVVLALNRLRKIRSTEERFLPLYSDAELKEYRENQECLSQEIIRLSEDCWYYHGWMLPEADFEASVFSEGCGLRHLEHPERFADRDIIDAGAYIGDSALVFSPLTRARVWAFEPTTENHAKLLKTIDLNSLTNVVPCRMALGNEKGRAEMAKSMIASVNTQIPNSAVPYTGTETVEVTTLDSFVAENGLTDSVRMPGFIENPYPFMRKADLLVCSSVYEGYSTFMTEGVILGKPIVTTDVSGAKELFGDSEYGLIVENDDEAFYQGLKRMLMEPDLRASYSEKAVSRSGDFSAVKLTNRTEQYLSVLLEEN